MTIVGNFVLLKDQRQFENACAQMARDISLHLKLEVISVNMSSSPASFPCLMQVQYSSNHLETKTSSDEVLSNDPGLLYELGNPPGEVNVQVFASYVYVKDAKQLLAAAESSDEVSSNITDTLAEATQSTYVPSPVAVLLLALINELKGLGAIKKDKLLEAVKKSEHWLTMMQERNEEAPMQDILRRFWEYS